MDDEKAQRKDIEKAMRQVAEELGDLKASNVQLQEDKGQVMGQMEQLQGVIKV